MRKQICIAFCWIILLQVIAIPIFSQKTVTIGKQIWSTTNLNVGTFRNNDRIPQATTQEEWTEAGENKQPAWCYYEFDPENAKYGRLYNWYAVNDPRKITPIGWHVPTDAEWKELINFLGGEEVAGRYLKSKSEWTCTERGIKKVKSSGFNGLPGGLCDDLGVFNDIGEIGYWWSATEYNDEDAWGQFLYCDDSVSDTDFYFKEYGFSVRCIKD
jgi:uncharacterized protein (TIGR02145 family)